MKAKVENIASHGINCFVNRQLIYNYPESLLAEKGIMVIEHADFEGVERLSLVTGGEITSTFERPDLVKLGKCELIEEIMIGEDKVSSVSCLFLCSCWPGCFEVDQILGCCCWRSLYRRSPWLNKSNGRRSRAIPPWRPLRPLPDGQRNKSCPRWWMLRNAHVLRCRRGSTKSEG